MLTNRLAIFDEFQKALLSISAVLWILLTQLFKNETK